jgi:6-phosphogluconolactonase/glucosamine-6-phosphate isomerase/deaminase
VTDAAIAYGADPPPTYGLTLGMAGIRAAREVWLLATGSGEAGIVTLPNHAGPPWR